MKNYQRYLDIREGWRHFQYSGLNEFYSSELASGIHTIDCGVGQQDFLLDVKEGAPLTVFMHGAMNRSVVDLPYFEGISIADGLDTSRLYLHDQSLALHPEMNLGWHSGNFAFHAQSIIPDLIRHIAERLSVPRIFFFGGSGGGFGCMYYSKLFDGAIGIVWNPQTDISKFDSKSVERYARHAWRLENKELIGKKISSDLAPHYARFQKNNTTIVYLQNRTDWHVAEHLLPFFAKIGIARKIDRLSKVPQKFHAMGTTFKLIMGDYGDGHVGPSRTKLRSYLHSLLDVYGRL